MPSDGQRTYSQEEVRGLLRRALEQQDQAKHPVPGFAHEELVETAREVGIEPAALEAALAEERREREEAALRVELRQAWMRPRQIGLGVATLLWAMACTLCLVIDRLTPGGPWYHLVALPWLGVLVLGLVRLLFGPTKAQMRRLGEKRRRREERRQKLLHWQRRADNVAKVVEDGASLLVSHLAEQVRQLADGPSRPAGDGDTSRGAQEGSKGVGSSRTLGSSRTGEPSRR